jgi:hypothetical protein
LLPAGALAGEGLASRARQGDAFVEQPEVAVDQCAVQVDLGHFELVGDRREPGASPLEVAEGLLVAPPPVGELASVMLRAGHLLIGLVGGERRRRGAVELLGVREAAHLLEHIGPVDIHAGRLDGVAQVDKDRPAALVGRQGLVGAGELLEGRAAVHLEQAQEAPRRLADALAGGPGRLGCGQSLREGAQVLQHGHLVDLQARHVEGLAHVEALGAAVAAERLAVLREVVQGIAARPERKPGRGRLGDMGRDGLGHPGDLKGAAGIAELRRVYAGLERGHGRQAQSRPEAVDACRELARRGGRQERVGELLAGGLCDHRT